MIYKNRAFTLAEVLITLVIVGVIASMTIPTLMNNTNKHEYAVKLKKVYSVMARATNRIIAEEGKPRGDIGGWATDTDNVYRLYKKYLRIEKNCQTGQGCFANETYKYLTGNNARNLDTYNLSYFRKFILADGASVLIGQTSLSCSNNYDNSAKNDVCIQFWVDINGAKKPNMAGKDWFAFVLKEDGLHPKGCEDTLCPSGNGLDCACKVFREGAINY